MENNSLKYFVFACIISADNDEFGLSEDQKQEIMARYHESKDNPNWTYILECMPDKEQKRTMIKFFRSEEKDFFNNKVEADGEPIQDKALESCEENTKSV